MYADIGDIDFSLCSVSIKDFHKVNKSLNIKFSKLLSSFFTLHFIKHTFVCYEK